MVVIYIFVPKQTHSVKSFACKSLHYIAYGGALLQHPKSWGNSRWPCSPCSDAHEKDANFTLPDDFIT